MISLCKAKEKNVNFNKKPTLPKSMGQPFNRPAAAVRPLKPVVAQLKTAVPAQSIKRPVAPPVYRPQPAPRVAQAKMSNSNMNPKPPVTPPVYYPQPSPKVLQKKTSPTPIHNPRLATRPPRAPMAHRPVAKQIVQTKTISHVQPKHASRVIQRTEEERENLRNLGKNWNQIAEKVKDSAEKKEFFGVAQEIQDKLGLKVYTVWHKHDPYIGGGKNKSYKKMIEALKSSADVGKTYAEQYIAWAVGPLSIADLPEALQELVIIVHVAEVGRGYTTAPESVYSFMRKVAAEPSPAKRLLLWNSFKEHNVFAFTAKEDSEFKPDPMEMGDDVPGYVPPVTRAKAKAAIT